MKEKISLRVSPKIAATPSLLEAEAARELRINPDRIKKVNIIRRSIDARQRRVMVSLTVEVHIDSIELVVELPEKVYGPLPDDAPQAIVVGAGPAGLFAALTLIERGIRPILLERGKDVDSRRKDLAAITRSDTVNPDSNYAFGEGGAGAYSDGKLYTRSKKRGNVEEILKVFHTHGAPDSILIDAHPHIGTDLLPGVIKAIRQTIVNAGGIVKFNTRVSNLLIKDGEVVGVETAGGETVEGPVILATGHSARDVYRMLNNNEIRLEPKGIAVGVRLEHPSALIDRIQYHSPEGRGKYLPAAEYSMLTRIDDRAVYSFCMCPGGVIVPAAGSPGELVVNGMSPSNRGTRWSNSGMVVEVLPDDVKGDSPLKMMDYQEKIEKAFFEEAGGHQNAAAQRMTDFVAGKLSKTLPPTSYAPGVHSGRVDKLLPDEVSRRLREGFKEFGRKSSGFLTDEAIVIGPETRTSAPVRVPRDSERLNHIELEGLYPAGEGAGYAGGIVSAAIDGVRCANALADSNKILKNF